MRESMYSALFGAMSNEVRMNTISNNLANVNTTGFKKQAYAFQDTFQRFAHDYLTDPRTSLRGESPWPKSYVQARPRLGGQYTDQAQGSLQATGNSLDLALAGSGYFKVRTPKGDMLTRNGSFQLSADGRLINEQGYEVLAGGGPITLPRDNKIQIDANGRISADGTELGVLDLVDVSDPKGLEMTGKNLFSIKKGSQAAEMPPSTELTVQQGYLEKSNVEIVTELVNMMEAQRAFEINQKIMTSTDTMESLVINKVGQIS